jgi:DNA-binding LacI/PurR family transcriptional regulator
MGREAANLFFERIGNNPHPHTVVLKTKLVARESSIKN